MKEREFFAKVFGDVQGQGYRAYLKMKAGEFGITGFAENMPDGTVEVIAQGKEEVLRNFLEFVYSGPENAQVDNAEVSWGPVSEKCEVFEIR